MAQILYGTIEKCKELVPNKEHYYHNTTLVASSKIFSNAQFRLGCFIGLNDGWDYRSNSFLMCFSTQTYESIPLWFLYSGIHGDGLRISFTTNVIDQICNGDFYFEESDKIRNIITPTRVIFRHMLYYENNLSKDKDFYGYHKIKINDKVFYVTPHQLNEYRNNNPGLSKTMEWDYEKEVRLIVDVDSDCFNKYKDSGIFFSIKERRNSISIKKGPNAPVWSEDVFEPIRRYYGGMKRQQYSDSSLSGSIHMKLCRKCTWPEFRYRRNE